MNRHELASYLASIITVLNDFDDNGTARPEWLTNEYTRAYNELKEMVKDDETGKSE